MKKILNHNFIKFFVSFFAPFLILFIFCMIRGISLSDIYIPASLNNDCVFYYKMVDSVMAYGGPLGYFGYNESHALIGGFGVWSPLAVLLWSIWGAVFGWGFQSGLICNAFFVSLGFLLFSYYSEVELKKILSMFILLFLFPSFSINVLSLFPEALLLFFLLVYFGLAFGLNNKGYRLTYVLGLYFIGVYLTMVRPYFSLLIFLPSYFLIRSKKKKKIYFIISITVLLLSLCGYYVIDKFFTSDYFASSFNFSLFDYIRAGDVSNAIGYTKYVICLMADQIMEYIRNAFSYGLTVGTQFFALFISIILMLPALLKKFNDKHRIIYAFYIFNCLCILVAEVFIAQLMKEAGRHLWSFAILGIVLICTIDLKKYSFAARTIVLIFFCVFCTRGALIPTDYDVPVKNAYVSENVDYWRGVFAKENIINTGSVGYDNTVIWIIGDYIGDDLYITEYRELFALPPGIGISCCYPDYILNNFSELKSRYIITLPEGYVYDACTYAGYEVVGISEYVVMFRRY